jgi:hypothetical protein
MTCVSTPRFMPGLCARWLLALPLALPFALPFFWGCAKVTASDGSGGGGGSTGPGNGLGGNHGTGTGGRGVVPDSGTSVDGNACNQVSFSFVPKIPNVFVLVDGSGSMFDVTTGLPNGRWGALRSALLPVIMSLQDQVNFGLGIFAGVIATNECPLFQTVPIAASNYANVMAQYPAARLRPQSVALETPLSQVLPLIPDFFARAPKTGASYVLFATDGEPDFCDNGNAVCPVDAGISGIQQLFTQGITTIVMGLSSDINAGTCPQVLQGYANAGAGVDIANPCGTHSIYNECNGVPPWKALATQLGRTTGQALVDYKATGGAAKVYSPNIMDQQSLTDALASLFSGVKSCTFDLTNVDGKSIKVNTNLLSQAKVLVETTPVPLDDSNGWRVNCVPVGDPACKPTQLELTGNACTNWRLPANVHIDFQFPCEVIIPG